ncbi:MAG: hypothetical protein H6719_14940 [Sandaracinaceae bacterium]|nr:hypothetical protein [Sandaracinaceae bacterium]
MRTVTVPRLGEHTGSYTFRIGPAQATFEYIVEIPGHGGGRDGPTDPDHPEQQTWMRECSGLREVWYLCWEIPSEAELRRFWNLLDDAAGGDVIGPL